ncbi:hypothetical protein, conserved [Leishmania tarentolae]|uniref:Uncharacterized protein n=1 Tax=Leishmania tarentolae TaxID=5689 RepID=A0A640KPG8_LEITA|nr:hypothetical protein, conserved [Leishmania tarentolae]
MGAAPSRETVENRVAQPPFYGQRQQIFLIPLLKKFFPSPDCPLFVQLYEARCDPAVRYYYYANDGIHKVQSTPVTPVHPTMYAAEESIDNAAWTTYLTEAIGNAPVYCSPADVFPSVPLTREAMYDAYITNGGEKMVYDTDEAMLRAYRADATSVRPLPCAVAFLYRRPPSTSSPTTYNSVGEAGCEGSAGESFNNEIAADGAYNFPEDCTEVLDYYVKVTGFMGDVHGLGASCPRKLSDCELQMFLTKSAGDHHRIHVLFTAVYMYAEQWQRACLHCVPCNLTAEEVAPASTNDGDASDEALGDVFFYYKPFSQSHDLLMEASRRAVHHGTAKPTEGERNGDSSCTLEVNERARIWAPPPLSSLFMRSRRANVPLLCFLREMRTCARSFFFFKCLLEHQDLLKPECGERLGGADGEQDGPTENTDSISSFDHGVWEHGLHLPPPDSVQMWLQEATRVPTSLPEIHEEQGSTDTESMLNFHMAAPYVRALTEFIVACLLYNINPLEVSQLLSDLNDSEIADLSVGDDTKDIATTREAAATDAVGGSTCFCTSGTNAAVMAERLSVATPFSLIRLPDEDMLVQTWPPGCSGAEISDEVLANTAAAKAAVSTPSAGLLSAWRFQHTNYHLFWSVGPNIMNRRTATEALLHWYKTEKAPVVWGYQLYAKDCEIVADGKGSAIASCSGSAGAFSTSSLASYVSTVTVNGQREVLLRCNTVLGLMRLEAGMPAEARVLCVCRVPLEEVLLGELRNSSKLAREAGPEDSHWVRQTEIASGDGGARKYAGCVLHASDSTEGESGTVIANKGVDLSVVPQGADGIIGDGTSCLWRVSLIERICRIIAVTPGFLKPIRRKHTKKKLQPKVVIVHGTASHVFLPVVSASPTTASLTSVSTTTTAPVQKGVVEPKENETTSARTSVSTSPDKQASVALEEEEPSGTVALLNPLTPDTATATATASTTAPPSDAATAKSEKRAKKTADAAAAPGSTSTSTTAELKTADKAVPPKAVSASNVAAPADSAAFVTQLKSTKESMTTPAGNSRKACKEENVPSKTAPHTAAILEDKKRRSSSRTPLVSATKKANTTKSTARAPGASATAGKSSEGKTDATVSGGSPVGAAEAVTKRASAAKHASIQNTRRRKRTPSPRRLPQPPVPAGEYDSNSKSGKAVADGKHLEPSAISALGSASATNCALLRLPRGRYCLPPPSYEANTPQQLRRGPYEQHSYDYRAPPPPLPFTDVRSSAKATPSHGGFYYYSSKGYQPHAGYSGGFGNSDTDAAGYYNAVMPSGAAVAADADKHMGDGIYGDSPYLYAVRPQELQAVPPLHQPPRHLGASEEIRGGCLSSPVRSYSLPVKEDGNSYQTTPTVAPGSHQGTASSLRHHVDFGTDADVSKEAVAEKAPLSSLRRGATLLHPGALLSGSSTTTSLVSPNTHCPSYRHTTAMSSPLLQQGYDNNLLKSQDSEDYHNASVRCTGLHPYFQPDELNFPSKNDSNNVMTNRHYWYCTRHANSPYQASTAIMEDAGVLCSQGCSLVGGSVNVTVRVRHHHSCTHSHAASYLSDATLDSAGTHHHYDMAHHVSCSTSVTSGGGLEAGAASLNGAPMAHKCAGLERALNTLNRPYGARCGSPR